MNYDLWFILLPIKDSEKIKLIKHYKNAQNIYENFEDIYTKNKIFNEKLKNFQKDDMIHTVSELSEKLKREKIGYITYSNPLYEEKLSGILDPPYNLFFKGNIEVINNKSIGIVGARQCSNYAFTVTKLLTKELITNNITLISGGAKGVDSIAHETALENKGKNITVLGCGIDITYPKMNKNLFSEICKDGVLISEFLPGTAPLRRNFPRRNRIISGLSDSIIVVEASEKSGSLITAHYAMEQGKNVISVPGSILYEGARGSNQLIKEGSSICLGVEDLRSILSLKHIEITPMKNDNKKIDILKIINDSPIHIDEIFKRLNMDRGKLYALLFEMQIKNEILCLPGNYYVKVI